VEIKESSDIIIDYNSDLILKGISTIE
jgi:hypothetical protein